MGSESIRLKDIAQAAQVTEATVSMALRNHPNISQSRKDQILQIAKELGYTPNPLVSALMTQVSRGKLSNKGTVLAYLNTHIQRNRSSLDPYLITIYEGAKERAESLGYQIEWFDLGKSNLSIDRFNKVLRTRAIRGVLIPPLETFGTQFALNWDAIAAVTSGWSLPIENIHRVIPDEYDAVTQAMRYLHQKGYRRPAVYLHDNIQVRTEGRDRAAYYVGLENIFHQSPMQPILLKTKNWNKAALQKWVLETRPDSLICAYGLVYEWIRETGLRVPEDIAFIALNAHTHTSVNEHLTRVDRNLHHMGREMVNLLSFALNCNEYGLPEHPRRIIVDAKLIQGNSA